MSGMNNERNPHVSQIPIGTPGASKSLPGMHFRKHSRIKAVHYIDQAGLAADNTNFLQLSLQDLSNNVVASLDTRAANQGALTALTPKAMPLAAPVGDVTNQPEADLPAGTDLKVVVTVNGTGVPTLGLLQIEWYPL